MFFGAVASCSLPLGSVAGLFWTPRKIFVAAFLAFGSGALLSALTIDLVGEALETGEFNAVAVGAICGSIIFIILNDIINNHGGFLRKAGTTLIYLNNKKTEQITNLIKRLSRIPLFQKLPAEEMQMLYPMMTCRFYKKGEVIVRQNEPGDSMFIIEKGVVDVENKSRIIATLTTNDVLGEIALVTGEKRTATAIAKTDVRVWAITKADFDRVIHFSPTMAKAISNIVASRIEDLKSKKNIDAAKAAEWEKEATMNIEEKIAAPTTEEIKAAAAAHTGAPLAIWLGNLLDGIPGALVIGSSLVAGSKLSIALIAAFFLNNFPESMSSSIEMRQQDYSKLRIFTLWFSQMIIISAGAALGNIFFTNAPHYMVIFVDGIAAGAMMTVIAETMLPEAFHRAGAITGISTLLGFLTAIYFKTLE
jgi:CRP-like cAMP-binding protein